MNNRINLSFVIFLGLFTCTPLLSQENENFELEIETKMRTESRLGKSELESNSMIHYSREKKHNKVSLAVSQTSMELITDGKLTTNFDINKFRAFDKVSGIRISADDGSAKGRQLKSYGRPILELEVDEFGNEKSRKLLLDDEEPLFVKTGEYHNPMIFHGPFFANKKSWDSQIRFPVGNGQILKGKMHYELIETVDGISKVKITSALSGQFDRDGFDFKATKYTLSGFQSFDKRKGEWVSGKLNVKFRFQLEKDGELVNKANGTMIYTLKLKQGKTVDENGNMKRN